MKKNLLLLLTSFVMACIGAGCSDDEYGFKILDDKIVYSDGYVVKYSPRDLKDYPDFLHVEAIEAAEDGGMLGSFIWTGILDGKRHYGAHSMICSQLYGYIYTEDGEYVQTTGWEKWTDVEVIYIDPKYIEYCRKNKTPLRLTIPRD